MATPYICLGTSVIVPTGGLTLAWTAVLTDGSTTTTLNSADGADPVLTAGTYSPDGFINHCAKKIQASIWERCDTDSWVIAIGTVDEITVKIGTPATITPGVGTVPLSITVSITGANIEGPAALASFVSFTLVNTATAAPWCWLGLAYPGESRALTVAGGTVTAVAGRAQPRWLFFLRASFQDTGDLITFPNQYSYNIGAGRVSAGGSGDPHQDRTIRLVTQTQAMIGPPWHISRFSAFGATRELLTYLTLDETLFLNISSASVNSTYLTSPVYLRAGRWWARYRDTTGGALRMFDVWPSAQTPTSGQTIQACSEGYALVEEWRRTGLLFRYDPIDSTGSTAWTWQAYAPNATGDWRLSCDRVGNSLFYTLELPCKLVEDPQLAVP